MGTPEFAVPTLEWLVSSEHQVVGVYTQPDRPAGRGRGLSASPVKVVAERHHLEVRQPLKMGPAEVEHLANLKPDVIVLAAFGQLLRQEVLDIPCYGGLNVHPSLLPRHRGPSPVARAILAGDSETGVTIMLMDAGMDTGPILSQARVAIEPQATTGTLTACLAQVSAELLAQTLPQWLKGEIKPQPQDERQATYTQRFSKEDGELDWRLPAEELWRRVRAFQPWPGCYTRWQGGLLKILEAIPIAAAKGDVPGKVIALDAPHLQEGAALGVVTGNGVLGICRLQPEGKRAMSAAEFLRGHRGLLDSVLPTALC